MTTFTTMLTRLNTIVDKLTATNDLLLTSNAIAKTNGNRLFEIWNNIYINDPAKGNNRFTSLEYKIEESNTHLSSIFTRLDQLVDGTMILPITGRVYRTVAISP